MLLSYEYKLTVFWCYSISPQSGRGWCLLHYRSVKQSISLPGDELMKFQPLPTVLESEVFVPGLVNGEIQRAHAQFTEIFLSSLALPRFLQLLTMVVDGLRHEGRIQF